MFLLYIVCLTVPCFVCEVFGFPAVTRHNAEGAQEIRVVLQPLVKSVEVFCKYFRWDHQKCSWLVRYLVIKVYIFPNSDVLL